MKKPVPMGRVSTNRPRRITIQYDATAQSTTDGSVSIFSSPQTLFTATTISWTTMGGRTELLADQPRSENMLLIRIRWRSDFTVTPANRVLYVDGGSTSHYLDIINVTDVGNQHQYWDLVCREKGI